MSDVVDRGRSTTVVRVTGVGKRYVVGGPMVLAGVTFDVTEGELVAIVGPSGCGKTTLLRIMSGLLPPSDGAVLLDGRPVVRPSPQISLVFQDYSRSLFPWLDVLRNVMFPLHRLGLSRAERAARAAAALDDVGLNGVARSYPWQLSGGMQQRVAIARALVSRPEVVFLDEPFAAVDALTRADLQDLLLALQDRAAERRVSIVHVTHDVDEAVYLADRVLVLTPSPGTVAASIDVGIPRPRAQTVTRSSARFLAVRNEIYDAIARHRQRPEGDR